MISFQDVMLTHQTFSSMSLDRFLKKLHRTTLQCLPANIYKSVNVINLFPKAFHVIFPSGLPSTPRSQRTSRKKHLLSMTKRTSSNGNEMKNTTTQRRFIAFPGKKSATRLDSSMNNFASHIELASSRGFPRSNKKKHSHVTRL